MRPLRLLSGICVFILLALAVGVTCCSEDRTTHKKNKQVIRALSSEEIKDLDRTHEMQVHLDEMDELHQKVEKPLEEIPEEHPPKR